MADSRETIIEKVRTIAERVTASEGMEVVAVEMAGTGKTRTLRVFIDRPPADGQTVPLDQPFGVTLDDCEFVSQQLGTILDIEDVIPGGRYQLEVSSPGVERKLYKLKDFERFRGHEAKIHLTEPVEEQKFWMGRLEGVEDGIIQLQAGSRRVQFPYALVEKAQLKFSW